MDQEWMEKKFSPKFSNIDDIISHDTLAHVATTLKRETEGFKLPLPDPSSKFLIYVKD